MEIIDRPLHPEDMPGDAPHFDWKCTRCRLPCNAHSDGFYGRISYCCQSAAYRTGDSYPVTFEARMTLSDALIEALGALLGDGEPGADGWKELEAHHDAMMIARRKI
jgi:hypothetical protein